MDYATWEPTYRAICADLDLDPAQDEKAVRVLRAVTLNLDLTDEDGIMPLMQTTATVCGAAACLESDLLQLPPAGTHIVTGSAVTRATAANCPPDIVVTDLDGDLEPQLAASAAGALTLILAHGDNMDLVRTAAPLFRGPVVLTTQGPPHGIVLDFGGFTDGDRAVCLARAFGVRRIRLVGFDFDHPYPKAGSDPNIKRRKLAWAQRIIFGPGRTDLVLPQDI